MIGEEKMIAKTKVEEANKMVEEATWALKKQQKVLGLLKTDRIETIKNLFTAENWLYIFLVRSACKYFNNGDEECKPTYDKLIEVIKSDFCNEENLKITRMLIADYDGYGYYIEFMLGKDESGDDTKYQLFIPDVGKLNEENFVEACEGKMSLCVWDKSLWKEVESSYFADDIWKAWRKMIFGGGVLDVVECS